MNLLSVKYFKAYLSIALICVLYYSGFGQLDSIMRLVKSQKNPEAKALILINASHDYAYTSISLIITKRSYSYALQSSDNSLIAKSSLYLANEYFYISNLDSASFYTAIAAENYEKENDSQGVLEALLLKSSILVTLNKTQEALQLNKKLLSLSESLKESDDVALSYVKMGVLFQKTDDLERSNSYFSKALAIYLQNKSYNGMESCYLNLGNNNLMKSYNDLAIEYFERGLVANEYTRNDHKRLLFLNGIASVYYTLGNFNKALDFYKDALNLAKDIKDEDDIPNLNNNIGTVLMELDKPDEAKPYLIEVYFASRNQADKTELALFSSFNLAQLYYKMGDHKSAMDYMNIYVGMNDSLNNIQNVRNLSEIEAKYQNEKKEEQNTLLNERLKHKSMQIYFALGALVVISILAFFIFRGLKEKQRANIKLEEKSKIIEEKNTIVEQQHKDITDSIKYAERIQSAILPPEKLWKTIIPQSFVFYQPKDILSGDFYWIEENDDFVFIAAADCTGHGVPGALMSILNYNHLNKAVLEKGLTSAGSILDGVNEWLTQSLHQSFQASAVRDGMDVSLCVIDKKTHILNFAGAYNSIYIIRDHVIEELISDKQPVGAFIEDNIKPFHNTYIQLQKDDVVYMFTDGYADQFGGEKGKKYKYKKLQALLLEIHKKPYDTQKHLVSESINTWKRNLEQIDDMLLLGFKWM